MNKVNYSNCHFEHSCRKTTKPRNLSNTPKCKKRAALPSFTLFESVIAITIITILIGISTLIYSNVIDSEKPLAYYQAKQEVSKIFADTKTSQAFFTKNYPYEIYDIEQKVEFYKGNKKLYQIDYTIRSKGKVWWTEKHLVANTQNAL